MCDRACVLKDTGSCLCRGFATRTVLGARRREACSWRRYTLGFGNLMYGAGWKSNQVAVGLSCHKSTIIGHVSSSTQLSIVAVKMIQHSCEPYWAPAVCNIICREKIWHTIAWWYMIVWGSGFWLHTITYWHVGLQHPIHSMSSRGEIVRGDSAKLEERARLVQNLSLVVK